MANDKKAFMAAVSVLYDTREQKNAHILDALAALGVPAEQRKLDYGDYSFVCGRDFSMSCVIERKANIDEIYGNLTSERGRIEKELYAASQCAKQMTIIIEGCKDWEALKSYTVPDWQMRTQPQRVKQDIGKFVYTSLKAWKSSNRYKFDVAFCEDKTQTAAAMLEIFYYYWRNYKEMTAARR